MNSVPAKNGRPCVFRVVHVSGTMRKVEEEAIRRARKLIFEAKGGQAGKTSSESLSNIFSTSGRPKRGAPAGTPSEENEDEGNSNVEMGEISEG
jgi:ribonuclease P/MRP protein subunit POP5